MTDAELLEKVSDADILLLSNRPLSQGVIEACPNLKLICVAFTGSITWIKKRARLAVLCFVTQQVTRSMR